MIAALAAAAGVFFTGQSLDATRTQTTVAEQGQLTDRFTKAVDQLDRVGADHLHARLGGIYALERLARDSPRDHPTIVEVITAFIRNTVSYHEPAPGLGGGGCLGHHFPAPDVQAALTVLGRRDTSHDQTTSINLRNTCLARADLRGADLGGANLRGTNLIYANLDRADLRGADLSYGADLTGANLSSTDLRGADLGGAELITANLSGADLNAADLSSADLDAAYLHGADFSGADLSYANLNSAVLNSAVLTRASLGYADLTGAYLNGAVLTGAAHNEHTVVADVQTDRNTRGMWW